LESKLKEGLKKRSLKRSWKSLEFKSKKIKNLSMIRLHRDRNLIPNMIRSLDGHEVEEL